MGMKYFLHFGYRTPDSAVMSQQFAKDVVLDGVRSREENLPIGLLAGFVAAIVGAFVWMGVAVATGWRVGFVAIAVGALVGLTVRVFGNGRGMIFGIFGAVLTLASCLGGEILAQVQRATSEEHDFYNILTTIDLVALITNIFNQMDPMMYLIYGIGIFEGYKLSMRK
jgi:hypothetical protein